MGLSRHRSVTRGNIASVRRNATRRQPAIGDVEHVDTDKAAAELTEPGVERDDEVCRDCA